jgi:hypothetical protein
MGQFERPHELTDCLLKAVKLFGVDFEVELQLDDLKEDVENFEALISGKEQEITNKFKEELKRDPGNIFKKFSVSKMDPDAVKAVRAQIEDMAREHVVKKTIIVRMATMEKEKLIALNEQRIAMNSMNELNISQELGASLGPEDSPMTSQSFPLKNRIAQKELEVASI